MKKGHKVTAEYFTDDEYLQIINGEIIAEDGVNFTDAFKDLPMHWRWKIYSHAEGCNCADCTKF